MQNIGNNGGLAWMLGTEGWVHLLKQKSMLLFLNNYKVKIL